ncbi:disease resistance protein RGA2-like [Lycium barbarum]|uniref:disease resistance protein RGA2-like n=1 Tax=Lycium barbarum TaxID=112863 RepID=UPI00293F4530|nr:disease resistance protein RGA2-like [Lycium barbarum]
MAEAFLQILIDNLSSFIQGELGLFFGFKDEFEKLSSTFSTIQSVIEDAQEKQLKDKPLYIKISFLSTSKLECNNMLMWTLLGTCSVLTEPKVYGSDKGRNEIVEILLNNVNAAQELSVLPILGMGELGKTTLAQMVYNDPRVTDHF